MGWINRNSISPQMSPTSLVATDSRLPAAVARSPLLPVTRNDGRPSQGAGCAIKPLTGLQGRGLPAPGQPQCNRLLLEQIIS